MKTPISLLHGIVFSILFVIAFNLSAISQEKKDESFIELQNKISSDLGKKLSGVRYALMNATKEEVQNILNHKDQQDMVGYLSNYLKEYLGIKKFAFTETQKNELFSAKDISICDIVEVGLDPGQYKKQFGALGVYRGSSLLFRFCNGDQYKVFLSDIMVDAYSYHPNRFNAAFKRIAIPSIQYQEANRLKLKNLRIVNTKAGIDSQIANPRNPIVGEFKSLGLDKNIIPYQIAIIADSLNYVMVYMGGMNNNDWIVGELKAELIPTKSEKIFLCKWYDRSKKLGGEQTIIFDDYNSFEIKGEYYNDKYVRLR